MYWTQVNSTHNDAINLKSIVVPGSTIFSYAQHCHEATLTLAMALHETSKGDFLRILSNGTSITSSKKKQIQSGDVPVIMIPNAY